MHFAISGVLKVIKAGQKYDFPCVIGQFKDASQNSWQIAIKDFTFQGDYYTNSEIAV